MNKRENNKIYRRFQLNSFLVQLIARMLVIVLLLTGMFSLLTICSEINYSQKSVDASYVNMLNQTANAVELTLENLCEQIRQIAVNTYCVNAMVMPGNSNYVRTQNILTLLSNTVSSSELITEALLYTPTDGMLYTSYGSYLGAEEFSYYHWIEQYESSSSEPNTVIPGESYYNEVYFGQSDILLYQSFYPWYFDQIGILIFRLDYNRFVNQFLSGFNQANTFSIHVYSAECKPLLYGDDAPLLQEDVLNEIIEGGQSSGSVQYNSQNEVYYYISEANGLIYCYVGTISLFRTAVALGNANAWLLPLLFIFALLGVIYMAFKCYFPIRQLAETASTAIGQSESKLVENEMSEVELIGYAFAASQEKSARLSQLLERVQDDVLEHLFSSMIEGHNPPPSDITDIFDNLFKPFTVNSDLVIMGIAFEAKDAGSFREAETVQFLITLRAHLTEQNYSCCVMHSGNNFIVPIFFPENTDPNEIRSRITRLAKLLPVVLQSPYYSICIAYSSIYHSIFDIRYAHLEMQDFLKQKMFYQKDQSDELVFPDISNNISERIKQILRSVNEGDFGKAIEIIEQAAPEIASASGNPEEVGREFDQFTRALLDKVLMIPLVNDDSLIAQKARLQRIFRESSDVDYMEDRFISCLREVFSELRQRNKTKKYQNIIRATEYLAANYYDCDLSLNRTADYVGITPSYLSRLFREELGMAFVDYLRDIRIDRCKHFLTTTDMSITEIGYQVGFSSMQSFFRTFKKVVGMPPGTYRQNSKA